MPLFSISTTALKAGGKWLLRESRYALPYVLDALTFDFSDKHDLAALEFRRLQITGTRVTPAGTVEDRAGFKVDLLNVTAGDIDPTWTPADYTAVRTPTDVFLTTLQPLTSPAFTFDRYSAYRMAFNPTPDLAKPYLHSGPPEWLYLFSKPGTGAAGQAYQIASSVTLKTGVANHWGRFYLPNPYSSALAPGVGAYRWTSAYQTALANATRTWFNALIDAGFWPVVPVTQADKQPFHALLGISQVQVDDIPDVIRRRRPKQAALRVITQRVDTGPDGLVLWIGAPALLALVGVLGMWIRRRRRG